MSISVKKKLKTFKIFFSVSFPTGAKQTLAGFEPLISQLIVKGSTMKLSLLARSPCLIKVVIEV